MEKGIEILNEWGKNVKRVFDIILSIITFVILIPVFIFLAIFIKLTSKGPVLFKQRRIGINKVEFNIFKFRTMYIETPKDMPTHLLENPDNYITSIGKILRKTSLDELPQLINIINGDMSFVGPRPALFNQDDLIELRDKYNINSIRPGLTGWAQVNGRDELPIEVKVEYDRFYFENQSIWFDIKIMFKTLFNVFRCKGVIEGKQRSDKGFSV